jgi:hypothetical protein
MTEKKKRIVRDCLTCRGAVKKAGDHWCMFKSCYLVTFNIRGCKKWKRKTA